MIKHIKHYFEYMFADICPMNIKDCEIQDKYFRWTFRVSVLIAVIVWSTALVLAILS